MHIDNLRIQSEVYQAPAVACKVTGDMYVDQLS